MGKNKPNKPPKAAAVKAAGSSSSTSGSTPIGKVCLLVAVLVAGGAIAFAALGKPGGMTRGIAREVQGIAQGVQKVAEVAAAAAGVGEKLSERELLQQGRAPAGSKRPRCVDARRACESKATAETCAADAKLRRECCRSCHALTCLGYPDDRAISLAL